MSEFIAEFLSKGAAYVIAQAIGPITTVLSIVSAQLKNISAILIFELVANLLVALSYILLGGISGSYICIVACVQVAIGYVYTKLNREPPKIMTGIFILCYLLLTVLTYQSPADIVSGVCAVCFALSVAQTKASGYRFFMTISAVLWSAYDILIGAWGMLITHGLLLVSLVIAIVKQDIGKKDTVEK